MSPNLTVLLPHVVMILAACVFFLGGSFVRNRRIWGPLCLVTLAAAGWCLARVSPAAAHGFVVQDALSVAFQWACLGLGMLMALTAFDAQQESKTSSKYFASLLLCVSGTMLAGVAGDLIVVFLAVELVSVAAYVSLSPACGGTGREAAVKCFVLSILSSAVLLYGFSLLYGLTGTTNLAEIRHVLSASYAPGDPALAIGSGSRLGIVAMILIFGGLGFRLSIVPFHFGTPDIFQGTTAWNAGLLAVLPKAAAFVALIRVLNDAMAGFETTGQLLGLILAGVTMTVGNVMALFQTNIRRILAYTTISHGGFLLVGVAVGFWDAAHPEQSLQAGPSLPGGIHAALFCLGAYLLMIAGLFAVLAYLARPHRQIEYVDDLTGLHSSEPLAAACAAIFLLGLAGIPPLPGFWGRMLLLSASLSVQTESVRSALPVPNPGFVLISLVAAINLLMTAAVYLRIVAVLFLEGQVARPRPSGGQGALAAGMLAALLTIGLGLLPGPVLGYLQNADRASRPVRRQSEVSLPRQGQKNDGGTSATGEPALVHLVPLRETKPPPSNLARTCGNVQNRGDSYLSPLFEIGPIF